MTNMNKNLKKTYCYYLVDKKGNVYSPKGKLLKQRDRNNGYMCVDMKYKNYRLTPLVHRLVAEAFIPNPENKKFVNHIDGNKYNNCVNNLEWVTKSENSKHYHRVTKQNLNYRKLIEFMNNKNFELFQENKELQNRIKDLENITTLLSETIKNFGKE